MKIGTVSDGLGDLTVEAPLDATVEVGLDGVELNAGDRSDAPHLDLADPLADDAARSRFRHGIERRGLELVLQPVLQHPIDWHRRAMQSVG